MAEHSDVLTTNGLVTQEMVVAPVPAPRPAPAAGTILPTARKTFRVLTANVQSVPRTALTLAQAREDLRANAADGDLVMLQEIDGRYRRIVADEFSDTDWHVFFGPTDNRSPIAARRDVFDLLDHETVLVHPVRVGLHGRRYLTHVHLRHRELGTELHAVNVHLTPGAFSTPPPADAASRQAEWRDGMRIHDTFVEGLVATGVPVIGGGDYNRPLRGFHAEASARAGRRVAFGVDTASIDLLWFIDGVSAAWTELGRDIFRGREGRPSRRNSDHAARRATVALTLAAVEPGLAPLTAAPRKKKPKNGNKNGNKDGHKKGRAEDVSSFAGGPSTAGPGAREGAASHPFAVPFAGPKDRPFELTEFGDANPKKVDWKTRAALEEAERLLGYRLTVVQGSYNDGRVKASGPTHDGGGVVDLLAWDWRRKVTVLRDVGFAAWHRPARPGLWGEHIHAVLIEHGKLDPSAASQVVAYRRGRDGLKSNLVDDFPRPSPIPVFSYPPAMVMPQMLAGDDERKGRVEPLGKAFPPRRTLDGVDISHHQSGRMDLTAARAAGLRWWYVKATEGTSFRDKTYRKRVRQARAAGLPVGAYHFARPESGDAVSEARFFLSHIDLRAGDMVPMLDLEDIGDLTLHQLTEWTGAWVRAVTQELRRKGLVGKPVIYTPFNLEKGFGCLLWVARYSDDFRAPVIPRPWRRAAIWQHSNGKFGPVKSVPGIGHVDVNALHPDLPLSALRLRPVGQQKKRARGRSTPATAASGPLAPLAPLAPHEPVGVPTTAVTAVQPRAGMTTMPSVTTTTNGSTPTEPGSIVITLTLPLPATPAPVVITPDLTPLEAQLTLAAENLQGAIDSLPERSEP